MGDQEARELELYIDNDAALHQGQRQSILKNLATKKITSKYRHDLAVKLFGYLVEAGAKKYAKEFSTPGFPWHKMFDVTTRKAVANAFTRDFETEFEQGSYDHLLPKKYQAELAKKHLVKPHTHVHATRKTPTREHVKMHDPKVLRAASDRELRAFYEDEKDDVALARAEGARRGLSLHATKAVGNPRKGSSHSRKDSAHTRKAKSLEDYETEGYNAHTWYLASCPYHQPKIREAWQRGAWRWQQEQRAELRPKRRPPTHSKSRTQQLDRDIAHALKRRGR